MPRETSSIELAILDLGGAEDADDPAEQARLFQQAQTRALIAIAQELKNLRGSVEGLKTAVTDQDGFSSADHLRHIGDYVERIAKG